jgi:hypothetical protein
MPYEKTDAFKQGIIDRDGDKLKSPETSDEKKAYGTFHRLVFNIRRLMAKIPGGRSTIARYGAALWLIKEKTHISDKKLIKILNELTDLEIKEDSNRLRSGTYILTKDLPLKNGELLAKQNTTVIVEEHEPVGQVFDIKIFKGYHVKTKQSIYITQDDITF